MPVLLSDDMNENEISVTVETITPEKAKEYLKLNTANFRNSDRVRVRKYAADMRANDWPLTGDTIKFNGSILLDGQHRLQACVESQSSFTTVVVRNACGAEHIDRGKPRTAGQWLRYRGVKNYVVAASSARHILHHELGLWHNKGVGVDAVSDSGLIDFVVKHDAALQEAIQMASSGVVNKSLLAAVLFIGSGGVRGGRPSECSLTRWFSDAMRTGKDLSETDAVLHLRNRAVGEKGKQEKKSPFMNKMLLSKAWNMTVQGIECQSPSSLRMRFSGPAQEKPVKKLLIASDYQK